MMGKEEPKANFINKEVARRISEIYTSQCVHNSSKRMQMGDDKNYFLFKNITAKSVFEGAKTMLNEQTIE